MATKKRRKKKREGKRLEIAGVVVIALGVFLMLCIYFGNAGIVGETIKKLAFGAIGLAAYLLPVGIVALGIYLAIFSDKEIQMRWLISGIISFICILGLIQLASYDDSATGYLDYLGKSIDFGAQSNSGAGALAALYVYPIVQLIGKVGSYILYVTAMLVSLLITTNISVKKVHEKVSKGVKNTTESVKGSIDVRRARQKEKKKLRVYDYDDEDEEPGVTLADSDDDIGFLNEHNDGQYTDSPPFETNGSDDDYTELFPYKPESQSVRDVDFINGYERMDSTGEDTMPEEAAKPKRKPRGYKKPPISVLSKVNNDKTLRQQKSEMRKNANELERIFESFGTDARVINVSTGPVITRYEVRPGRGVKVSKISNLSDDISLAMAAPGVRIEAPIPGKNAIGIEVPNRERAPVMLREVLEGSEFQDASGPLPVALGKDIGGNDAVIDLAAMPHLLIAGTTGSGKSVCVNSLILSLLMRLTPDEVKLIMVDPKVVELSVFNGIPHLEVPVVTDARKAAGALHTALKEMMERYNSFADRGVRNIDGYNNLMAMSDTPKLPYWVVIIDELSDLMMVSPKDVEDAICRIAQMGRAAGIHLVVATQRPSVDVITGLIKANFPSRIAFAVSSQIDSRTILDQSGAEKLLGKGDMLLHTSTTPKPVRIQGVFVSDQEVETVIEHIKTYSAPPDYNEEMIEQINQFAEESAKEGGKRGAAASSADADGDMLSARAARLFVETGKASTSLLQRKLGIGYGKAARIMDEMEDLGVIGPAESNNKPREVRINLAQYEQMFGRREADGA